MKKILFFVLGSLLTQFSYAQRTVKELEAVAKSVGEEEFTLNFFNNTSNFTIYSLSENSTLREIEKTALLYGIDLKIKEYIKSNKLYSVTFEIKNGNDTIIETFQNGVIPLNRIEIEFHKNGNPEISEAERKATLTIKRDRNNTKNGNQPRVIFSN